MRVVFKNIGLSSSILWASWCLCFRHNCIVFVLFQLNVSKWTFSLKFSLILQQYRQQQKIEATFKAIGEIIREL